jgi:cytochrome P450
MTPSNWPAHPLQAVTHPDPYPYYQDLALHHPLYYDTHLHGWVASSAAVVEQVLTHPACAVRPPDEPIPAHLVGSHTGRVYHGWVRMREGDYHQQGKQAIQAAFQTLDGDSLSRISQQVIQEMIDEWQRDHHPQRWSEFVFHAPIRVLTHLLGIPSTPQSTIAHTIGDLIRALFPTSTASERQAGEAATHDLCEQIKQADGIAHSLRQHLPDEAAQANGIGLLVQTYDATAGLIGNLLVSLARDPSRIEEVRNHPQRLVALAEHVLRHDPPVQNTRRWLTEDAIIHGQSMQRGEMILVLLAAANQDPALELNSPHRAFGYGHHACPGTQLAITIAVTTVHNLLEAGIDLTHLGQRITYRPSINARIPVLT